MTLKYEFRKKFTLFFIYEIKNIFSFLLKISLSNNIHLLYYYY